jgi:chemotaxis protein CheX
LIDTKQTIATAAVQEFLVRHLAEVFSTMFSLPAVPLADAAVFNMTERVTGSVSFVGEAVTGSVYMHIPAPFAAIIAGAMLGLPPEELAGDADVNDVIGEVTNMVAGGLKSWLCDAGVACALTTPAIIRGTSFCVLPSEGVQKIEFGFASDAHQGFVETHIKFTH